MRIIQCEVVPSSISISKMTKVCQQGSLSKVTECDTSEDLCGHYYETEDSIIQVGTTGWIGKNRRDEKFKDTR